MNRLASKAKVFVGIFVAVLFMPFWSHASTGQGKSGNATEGDATEEGVKIELEKESKSQLLQEKEDTVERVKRLDAELAALENLSVLLDAAVSDIRTTPPPQDMSAKLKELAAKLEKLPESPSYKQVVPLLREASNIWENRIDAEGALVKRIQRSLGDESDNLRTTTHARRIWRSVQTSIDKALSGKSDRYQFFYSKLGFDDEKEFQDRGGIRVAELKSFFEQASQKFSADSGIKSELEPTITTAQNTITQERQNLSAEKTSLRTRLALLDDVLTGKDEKKAQIDVLLIQWGLPSFALIMLLLLLIPRAYPGEALQKVIFGSGLILELMTVFLLVSTVLILGLGNKLEGAILGSILSGITGYILGRNGALRPSHGGNEPPKPPVANAPENH